MLDWLKRLIAGPELAALERYRLACGLAWRWNGQIPASAKTAEWIRDVGQGERGMDIERFREELLREVPKHVPY